MCSLPPHNSAGCAPSAVALPVAVIKSLPLTAGLGLSLAIVLLHSSHSLAQTISNQEAARFPSQHSAAAHTITRAPTHAPASAQHLLFVSPIVGNDINADGSQRSPFRTITHALEVAQPNTVIMLAAGTYSADSGEIFPLMLHPGVTIQGDPSTQGRGIVIRGGGTFLSPTSAGQNIAILGANQSQLIGVTVTNPSPRGYSVWVESGSPVIADNTFTGNSQDSVATVGNSAPVLRNNRFDDANDNDSLANSALNNSALNNSAQANKSQPVASATSRPATAIPTATINELPPAATISSLPPSASPPSSGSPSSSTSITTSIAQAPANLSRRSAHAAIPSAASAVSQSTPAPEISVPPPTQPQAAIVPVAHPRSEQPAAQLPTPSTRQLAAQPLQPTLSTQSAQSVQPTIEISVPPPDNPIQPAAVSRSPTRQQPNLTQQVTPIATLPPVSVTHSANHSTVATAERANASSSAVSNSTPAIAFRSTMPAASDRTRNPVVVSESTPSTLPQPSASATPVPAPPSARSTPPAPAETAIEIPVPPPDSTGTTLAYAARPATASRSSAFTAPIEIPVPLPESSAVAPTAVRNQDLSPPETRSAVPSANLLPVPGGDVPIGNVGDLPRIRVASSQMNGLHYASSQIRSSLRYRVVVDASSEGTQIMVRSIIPGAFPTSINGQQLMQVGAFNSRDNAEQTVQLLTQNGLLAVIQEID